MITIRIVGRGYAFRSLAPIGGATRTRRIVQAASDVGREPLETPGKRHDDTLQLCHVGALVLSGKGCPGIRSWCCPPAP